MKIYHVDLSGIEDHGSIYQNIRFYIDPILHATTTTIDWEDTKFINVTYDESGGPVIDCIGQENANTPSELLEFA